MGHFDDSRLLDDPEFQSLLVACLESLQRGETIDREALARDFPQFAPHLGQFLDDRRRLESVASELEEADPSRIPAKAYEETLGSEPAARDSAARDSAARDSAVRDSAARDSAARDSAARDSAVCDSASAAAAANAPSANNPSASGPAAGELGAGAIEAGEIQAGERIRYVGECEVLEEIARGGMGVVFKARQRKLERLVALKMILAGRLAGRSDVERFRREARAAGRLQHPHIVRVHEVGEHEGRQYFTMDFVDGRSLAEQLRNGPLAPRQAAEIVRTVARAVDYAHERGVLHRDLKPANVLLTPDGVPHVTDFGLAKLLESAEHEAESEADLTATGQVLGTPSYMAPEQASGKQRRVDRSADIYALGAILYACLTGRAPFMADTPMDTLLQVMRQDPAAPRSLNAKVPRDLETICLHCLAKEPSKRYASAEALADDLDRFLEGRPVVARPLGPAARAWRWCRRNPAVASLSAAAVLLLITGLAVSSTLAWIARRSAVAATRNERAATAQEIRANRQADRATRMAGEARRQQQLAERRMEELAWQVYAAEMGDALNAWNENDAPRLHRQLNDCRWDFHGWEHDYLFTLLHSNQQTWHGPTGTIYGLDVSPDGRRLAVASHDGTIRIWDLARGRRQHTLNGHEKAVAVVAYTTDGKRLVSGSWDKTIKVWNAADGTELRTIPTPELVGELVVGPGGETIITSAESAICVWDMATGQMLRRWDAHDSDITSLAPRPDGQQLASSSLDQSVKIWELETGRLVHHLRGHEQLVSSVAYSPDGRRLISGALNLKVWDADNGEEIATLQSDSRRVSAVAFSPDGRWIAAGCGHVAPVIQLWDARTLQEERVLLGHRRGVSSLAWERDGRHLISGSSDETVKRWSLHPLPGPLTISAHDEGRVRGLAFSPDGTRLATATGHEMQVKVWDVESGQQTNVLDGGYVAMAFSPDGERIVSASPNRRVKLWEASTGERIWTTEEHHDDAVEDGVYSPDGTLVASSGGYHDRTIKIWNARTGECLRTLRGHGNAVEALAFRPDGRQLASGSWDETVRVWDVASGREVRRLEGHHGYVTSVAFRPDGKRLASGSFYGEIKIWDVDSGQQIRSLAGHPGAIGGLAYSPDGRRLASGGYNGDRTVRIWNPTIGQELLALQLPAGVHSVAFGSRGHLAAGLMNGDVRIWDASLSADCLTLHGHRREVNSVALSHQGPRMASGGGDWGTTILLWDTTTGRRLGTLLGHRADVTSVDWSPDDRSLASGSKDKTVKIWDVESGKARMTLEGHEAEVNSVAFTPEWTCVVSGSNDQTIRVWQAATGEELRRLAGHADAVTSVAVSSNGQRLASGSRDTTVRIWDATSGELLRTLSGHEAAVNAVAFSPDGRFVASASADRTIRIWPLVEEAAEVETRTLDGHTDAVLAVSFSDDGRWLVSGSADQTVRTWDWRRQRERRTWWGHTGAVRSVHFSRESGRIVSGSEDGTIKVWDAANEFEDETTARP